MENVKIVSFCRKYRKVFQKMYKDVSPKEDQFPVLLLFLNLIRKDT